MRTRESILSEMKLYLHASVPQESVLAWIESLPEDERQVVFAEASAHIAALGKWFNDSLYPIIEPFGRALSNFIDGLSLEAKRMLADSAEGDG